MSTQCQSTIAQHGSNQHGNEPRSIEQHNTDQNNTEQHSIVRRSMAQCRGALQNMLRDQQAQALAHCEEATEEMSVLLARPLGLCFLPAFMLLGVVPTVLELGGSYMQHFT